MGNKIKRMFFLAAAALFILQGRLTAADVCHDLCWTLLGAEFRTCMESCYEKNTGLYTQAELARLGLKCPEGMAYVPPGEFMMGCQATDKDCADDETPAHKVKITKSFCMDKFEATQNDYVRAMNKNPSSNTVMCGGNCPVESVTWNQARDYCRFVHKRLPTEAEWEYAARAGSETLFYWGKSFDAKYAWYNGNSGNRTHAVGKKPPNKFGLYDMLGNVWEWTADCYDAEWYERMPDSDPDNTKQQCDAHVARGGSWMSQTLSLSRRYPDYYNSAEQGFRCAWDFSITRE